MTVFPISNRFVMTARVSRRVSDDDAFAMFVADCIVRWSNGDDGELDPHDKKVNRDALECGERMLGSYALPDGMEPSDGVGDDKLWIITDRKVDGAWYATTVLWPSDY